MPAGIYRTDREPTAIGAIWERIMNKDSGGKIFSFSMVIQNADEHPFMRPLHKFDDEKRSVVVLENSDLNKCLNATHEQSRELIRLSPDEFSKTDAMAPEMTDLFS